MHRIYKLKMPTGIELLPQCIRCGYHTVVPYWVSTIGRACGPFCYECQQEFLGNIVPALDPHEWV
jgi:hypothetical protein